MILQIIINWKEYYLSEKIGLVVIGLMKDELVGKLMTEIAAYRRKSIAI